GLPGAMLALAVRRLLLRMPTDRGRIDEQLGTLHRGEARGFGIPLVPADEHTELGGLRMPNFVAEIAGREVILLVVPRIVRDVHLAVLAEVTALAVEHRSRIVINARGTLLEQARDERDIELGGKLTERLGARARDGFRQRKEI